MNQFTRFSLSMEMSRLTRDGTAEPVSRDQIIRRERGHGNIDFSCSADHVQDWQSLIRLIHTPAICVTIHTYIRYSSPTPITSYTIDSDNDRLMVMVQWTRYSGHVRYRQYRRHRNDILVIVIKARPRRLHGRGSRPLLPLPLRQENYWDKNRVHVPTSLIAVLICKPTAYH